MSGWPPSAPRPGQRQLDPQNAATGSGRSRRRHRGRRRESLQNRAESVGRRTGCSRSRRRTAALRRERQRLPDDRLEGLTERRPRAKRDEQVEPEHGWREDQRHSDQGFDEQLAAELAVREHAAKPDSEREQDDDRAAPSHSETQRPTNPCAAIVALRTVLPEDRARRASRGRTRRTVSRWTRALQEPSVGAGENSRRLVSRHRSRDLQSRVPARANTRSVRRPHFQWSQTGRPARWCRRARVAGEWCPISLAS